MNRIDQALARARSEKRAALIVFVTAGDPDLSTTAELIPELAAAGADVIELGIPHSDPIGEGATIQVSSQRALARRTSLSQILDLVRRVRAVSDVPLVLMGYLINVLAYGVERHVRDAAGLPARRPCGCLRALGGVPRMNVPVFYGWVIVAVAFVTMGIGVTARTAFSLLFRPILDEFGWERGVTAGAFSMGFVVSTSFSPLMGRIMDRRGPRAVLVAGVLLIAAGLAFAPLTREPWHLYLTLGIAVGTGTVCLGYTGHALFLPNWFVRRRGLAVGLAFSGTGVGAILLLPWGQGLIGGAGWRQACWTMAVLVLVGL